MDAQLVRIHFLIQKALGDDRLGADYSRILYRAIDDAVCSTDQDPQLGNLPILVCVACGGDRQKATQVSIAWRLVLSAAKLFDDVEDGEVAEDFPTAINLATGILFVAQLALGDLADAETVALRQQINQALDYAMLRAGAGQHADLRTTSTNEVNFIDPDAWLQIALAKSGEPFAWATWAGAIVGNAPDNVLNCYRDFGRYLGVLIQVADDYNGVWQPTGPSDLVAARPTLPVCYAMSVATDAKWKALETLLQQSRQDHSAELEAQQLLVELGAQTFLQVVAREQYLNALTALQRAIYDPEARTPLVHLLNHVFPLVSNPSE